MDKENVTVSTKGHCPQANSITSTEIIICTKRGKLHYMHSISAVLIKIAFRHLNFVVRIKIALCSHIFHCEKFKLQFYLTLTF